MTFTNMNVKELKKTCKEQGIKGYSKLKKQELINILSLNENTENTESINLMDLLPSDLSDIIYDYKNQMERKVFIEYETLRKDHTYHDDESYGKQVSSYINYFNYTIIDDKINTLHTLNLYKNGSIKTISRTTTCIFGVEQYQLIYKKMSKKSTPAPFLRASGVLYECNKYGLRQIVHIPFMELEKIEEVQTLVTCRYYMD